MYGPASPRSPSSARRTTRQAASRRATASVPSRPRPRILVVDEAYAHSRHGRTRLARLRAPTGRVRTFSKLAMAGLASATDRGPLVVASCRTWPSLPSRTRSNKSGAAALGRTTDAGEGRGHSPRTRTRRESLHELAVTQWPPVPTSSCSASAAAGSEVWKVCSITPCWSRTSPTGSARGLSSVTSPRVGERRFLSALGEVCRPSHRRLSSAMRATGRFRSPSAGVRAQRSGLDVVRSSGRSGSLNNFFVAATSICSRTSLPIKKKAHRSRPGPLVACCG